MEICIIYENSTLREFKERQKIKYNENLELIAKHINADNKLKKMFIFTLGSLFFLSNKVYAADPLKKIDVTGGTLLNVIRRVGYWICIIACIIEIVKSIMQGDVKSVGKIMMKFALGFAALYIFPWILDLIRSSF